MRSIARRAIAPLGTLVLVTTATSAASAQPAQAFVAQATPARVLTREGSRTPWLHVETGALRSRARAAAPAPLAALETRARLALARVSGVSRGASLRATTTDHFGDGDAIVHFEQTHEGLPVIGRGAAVLLSATGEARLTAVDLGEDLPAGAPAISAAEAAAAASARTRLGTATAADAHLVVWPGRAGARLAYAVLPRVPAGLPTAPRVIVDARTGKVLEARDLVQFAKANVHRFNPTKTPVIESVELPIAPVGDKLTSDFVTATNCIDRKTVRSVAIGGLEAKLHVCDVVQLASAGESGDFAYDPTDAPGAMASRSDEFSEVALYYHATKAHEFFRGLQGAPDATIVSDKPLRVIANLQVPAGLTTGDLLAAADPDTPLETFSNAFFAPAGGGLGAVFEQLYGVKGGGLWFGQGPLRDYAYDGDVVYHELTHAVVDATLKLGEWHVDARGAVDAPGAMNEGLADYFSSAITGDPDVGEYASKDLAPNSTVIRTLANQDACPAAVIGEVHFDSTLFSGALWQARSALPEADRPKLDAGIYKAMRTNPGRGDLGYGDLATLFAATLGMDFPAGAAALDAAMKARGILPSCDRIIEYGGANIRAIDPGLGGFASPGVETVAAGPLAPGLIQVHARVPAGMAILVVTFVARASGGGRGPLGGGGTPSSPVVLAKFGKPITWTTEGAAAHDAEASAVAMPAGPRMRASFQIPPGSADVYLQIANEGDSDGAYDDVAIELAPASLPPAAPEPAPEPALTASDAGSGCGCSTPGRRSRASGLSLAALASLAMVIRVVRRGRRA